MPPQPPTQWGKGMSILPATRAIIQRSLCLGGTPSWRKMTLGWWPVPSPNSGDGDVASIDIGGEAAAVAGERSETTGEDLRWTTWFLWPRTTCSKTFLRAARRAHLARFQSWSKSINCSCNANTLSLRNKKNVLFLVFMCFEQVIYI